MREIADQSFVEICEKVKTLKANKQQRNSQNLSTSEIHEITQYTKQKQNNNNQYQNINRYKSSLEGLCLRCGRNNHESNECKTKKLNSSVHYVKMLILNKCALS